MKIIRLHIEGFRSLKNLIWSPSNLNIIIGPNGSGKSNLLRCLELISISAQGKLGKTIQSLGGMDPIVWDGVARSIKFVIEVKPDHSVDPECYEFELVRLGASSTYRVDNERLINSVKQRKKTEKNPFKFLERVGSHAIIFDDSERTFVTPGEYVSDEESLLSISAGPFTINNAIPAFQRQLVSFAIYRDLDTRPEASIRQSAISRMEKRVDPDGQNLVSVLHTLYTGDRDFKNDINAAMQAAFGDDFEELVFPPAADQRIQLRIRWKSLKREQSAAELSDGTLRFLFLLTVLASPSLAPVIAIDEPETGLHPAMLPLIAEFAVEASKKAQIIFTTHSPQFLDAFTEVRPTTTVAKWANGETTLHTLDAGQLDYWLKEYSLGSLFKSGELEQMA
ncbi:MAG: AAA family ATPase [Rhodoferax sp.]|nr:AAA family ATPase [Rhodoferax sp.]